jgi:hypothetical protein
MGQLSVKSAQQIAINGGAGPTIIAAAKAGKIPILLGIAIKGAGKITSNAVDMSGVLPDGYFIANERGYLIRGTLGQDLTITLGTGFALYAYENPLSQQ